MAHLTHSNGSIYGGIYIYASLYSSDVRRMCVCKFSTYTSQTRTPSASRLACYLPAVRFFPHAAKICIVTLLCNNNQN